MNYSRKKHVVISGIVTAVFLFVLISNAAYQFRIRTLQKKHNVIINEQLSNLAFTLDSAPGDIEKINTLLELPHLSYEQRGLLYNLLTNMYFITSDFDHYLSAIGNTLFYYEADNNIEGKINTYLNFTKFLLQNGAYENAKETVGFAESTLPFEAIQDNAIRSIAYQMRCEVALNDDKPNEADFYIKKSLEAINAFADEDPYKAMYSQMGSIAQAKVLFAKGEYEQVRTIIDSYAEMLVNTDPAEMQYLVWEFFMPVYAMKTGLALNDGDFDLALRNYEIYCGYCEYYNFITKKIELSEKMVSSLPPQYSEQIKSITESIPLDYKNLSSFFMNNMCRIAEDNYIATETDLTKNLIRTERVRTVITRCLFNVFVITLLLLVISILFNEAQSDSLTKLPGKQSMNSRLERIKKFGRQYTVIKIDLDNFKQINNTYGVSFGDEVLRKVAGLMLSLSPRNAWCYRFSSETFAIIITDSNVTHNIRFAETIRSEIASLKFSEKVKVTASLGVGFSSETDKVLETADANVYYAKQHGKDFTAFTAGGKIQLAEQRLGIRNIVK